MIRTTSLHRRPAPRGLHQLGLRLLVRLYSPTDGPDAATRRHPSCRDRDRLAPCR